MIIHPAGFYLIACTDLQSVQLWFRVYNARIKS